MRAVFTHANADIQVIVDGISVDLGIKPGASVEIIVPDEYIADLPLNPDKNGGFAFSLEEKINHGISIGFASKDLFDAIAGARKRVHPDSVFSGDKPDIAEKV